MIRSNVRSFGAHNVLLSVNANVRTNEHSNIRTNERHIVGRNIVCYKHKKNTHS